MQPTDMIYFNGGIYKSVGFDGKEPTEAYMVVDDILQCVWRKGIKPESVNISLICWGYFDDELYAYFSSISKTKIGEMTIGTRTYNQYRWNVSLFSAKINPMISYDIEDEFSMEFEDSVDLTYSGMAFWSLGNLDYGDYPFDFSNKHIIFYPEGRIIGSSSPFYTGLKIYSQGHVFDVSPNGIEDLGPFSMKYYNGNTLYTATCIQDSTNRISSARTSGAGVIRDENDTYLYHDTGYNGNIVLVDLNNKSTIATIPTGSVSLCWVYFSIEEMAFVHKSSYRNVKHANAFIGWSDGIYENNIVKIENGIYYFIPDGNKPGNYTIGYTLYACLYSYDPSNKNITFENGTFLRFPDIVQETPSHFRWFYNSGNGIIYLPNYSNRFLSSIGYVFDSDYSGNYQVIENVDTSQNMGDMVKGSLPLAVESTEKYLQRSYTGSIVFLNQIFYISGQSNVIGLVDDLHMANYGDRVDANTSMVFSDRYVIFIYRNYKTIMDSTDTWIGMYDTVTKTGTWLQRVDSRQNQGGDA